MRHTPTPWDFTHRHIYKRDWKDGMDHAIANVDSGPTTEEAKANAAYIVTAVNHYAELVAALTEARDFLASLLDMTPDEAGDALTNNGEEVESRVQTVLAKLNGETP